MSYTTLICQPHHVEDVTHVYIIIYWVDLLNCNSLLIPTCTAVSACSICLRQMWTYDPVAALIRLVRHYVRKDDTSLVIVAGLDVVRQVVQLLNGIRLDVFIVEVIEQDIEALLSVNHVGFELLRCLRLDTLHICVQDVKDRLRSSRNVRPVAASCVELAMG